MFGAIIDNAALRDLYFAIVRRLQPEICCDIGANDGQAALLARQAAPRTEIFAFEANPELYALHQPRLAAAGVRYLNLAVNDRSGRATVFAPRTLTKAWIADGQVVDAAIAEPTETGKTSLFLRNESATYTEFIVPAESLDEFFAARTRVLDEVRFALWIDVEGATARVLKGARSVLESTDVIFAEVETYPFWKGQGMVVEVADLLHEGGFMPVARDREYGDDQFNVLFLKERLKQQLFDLLPAESQPNRAIFYPKSDIPVIIPVFNNPTDLRRMLAQLTRVGLSNIIIINHASTYPPLLDYLASLAETCVVLRKEENEGPRQVFNDTELLNRLPQFFCVTDPDLEFSPDLPPDFLQHLIELTRRYHIGKAGFALDISDTKRMISEPFQIGEKRYCIWEWERQFWQTPLERGVVDVPYRALIDTTFALYNKEFFRAENHLEAIRVGGRYTARHLAWYLDHRLPSEEAEFYRRTSRYSFYAGTPPSS